MTIDIADLFRQESIFDGQKAWMLDSSGMAHERSNGILKVWSVLLTKQAIRFSSRALPRPRGFFGRRHHAGYIRGSIRAG